MRVIHDLESMRRERRPVVLAAGFFDGVHRGHQRLIKTAVAEGRKGTGSAWVMTFDTHPMKVLDPAKAPALLTSTPHKLGMLSALGACGCVVIPFSRALAELEPESFIGMLKRSIPTLQLLCVGRNWKFGRGGRGTADDLKSLARLHSFKVRIIPPVCRMGEPVSSTRIRSDVSAGRLEEAGLMLGRPPSVMGTVVSGSGVGTGMGVPTANIVPHNEVYPPNGVYAAAALVGGRRYPGILNLGARPTLGGSSMGARAALVLEMHIFGLRRDLYRKDIEVFFLKKLRNERKFRSIGELKRRIDADIEKARRFLKKKKEWKLYKFDPKTYNPPPIATTKRNRRRNESCCSGRGSAPVSIAYGKTRIWNKLRKKT